MDSRSRLNTSTRASGMKHLEIVILSIFQPSDPEGTGFVQEHIFWEVKKKEATTAFGQSEWAGQCNFMANTFLDIMQQKARSHMYFKMAPFHFCFPLSLSS